MKKILFFPLLKMPSGHHHVADVLMNELQEKSDLVENKKIDILSDFSPILEKTISSIYLSCIKNFPGFYSIIYRTFANTKENKIINYLYKLIFLNRIEKIIDTERPDLIICTHSFPSLLISELKSQGRIDIPVINVYTDFFMNKVWANQDIDYHFAPHYKAQKELLESGIPSDKIVITGIPVDRVFKKKEVVLRKEGDPYQILVSGGSGGLGKIEELIEQISKDNSGNIFIILCGNNEKLYKELAEKKDFRIEPYPYLKSKKEINDLYTRADAIILKPGGVTVSEALAKNLPIFVHSCLPGQESINLEMLESEGLAYKIDWEIPFDEQLLDVLGDQSELDSLKQRFSGYLENMEDPVKFILEILEDKL